MPNHSLDCFLFFLAGITSFYHYIIFAFGPFDGHDGTKISISSVDVCSFQISLSNCYISISTFRVRKIDWYNQKLQQLQLQSGFDRQRFQHSDFLTFIIGPIEALPQWNKWNMSETMYNVVFNRQLIRFLYNTVRCIRRVCSGSEGSSEGLCSQHQLFNVLLGDAGIAALEDDTDGLGVFLKGTSADQEFD